MPDHFQKSQLRLSMRAQRKSLSKLELESASEKVASLARQYKPLLAATRVASYSSFAGEIRPEILDATLNAEIYLPKIIDLKLGLMQFYLKPQREQMSTKNKFGILEPSGQDTPLPPQELDAVLMPLVAFQRDGSRIGMGAGFYDRAFDFRRTRDSLKQPILIGLAHSFQETTQLRTDSWDVPLDVIITDQELIVV